VRTLYATGTFTTVVSAIETYRLDIVAIQELRWTRSGSLRSNNHIVFYGCNTNHEAGVGFIIKNDILPYVKNFIAYNDRLCYTQVECKWLNMALVKCYASTEEKGNQIKENFYSKSDTIYKCIPKIIMGDFNAKIEKEIVFKPTISQERLHQVSNDNGIRLITFAGSKNMRISSTFLTHKIIHKQTWMSPNGTTKIQINYVVTENIIKHWIQDVRSHSGVGTYSDHFLVKTTLR